MEMDDLVKMKMLERDGMTPYEQFKTQHMQAKSHTSGLAVGGLVTAVGAAVVGVAGALWAGSRAQNAKEIAIAKNDGLRDLVTSLATSLATERQERREGDINLTATINDTVSGSQQGSLSASQIATNEATAQILAGVMTGQYSQNPIKVVRVSGQRECGCDNGCM